MAHSKELKEKIKEAIEVSGDHEHIIHQARELLEYFKNLPKKKQENEEIQSVIQDLDMMMW